MIYQPFYYPRDTPGQNFLYIEFSTYISTFRGKVCGKAVGNTENGSGWLVDYSQ